MGKLIRSISKSGSAVCFAVDSTDIVEEARKIHGLSPTMTAVLGRTLTAASLMGSSMKNPTDSLTIRICGDGPCSTVIATSDSLGNVRGLVSRPDLELPLNRVGHLDVGGAVGKGGMLYVLKDIGLKEPYSGCIPLLNGEIAEDITEYFARSEQIPTACALGVLVDRDCSVKAAGGVLMHLLPFADEQTAERLERNASSSLPVTQLMENGGGPEEMVKAFFRDIEYDVLDGYNVSYKCMCSRQFVEKTLLTLGKDDLESMHESGKSTEIKCEFCHSLYSFTSDEIGELLKSGGNI